MSTSYAVSPEPVELLFVSNGYYAQEDAIADHLDAMGNYNTTYKSDYEIQGSTDLSGFDLILITGFAPNISWSGLSNIEAAGKPVLIVCYWDFEYAYHLGLLQYDDYDYVGTDTVRLPPVSNYFTRYLGNPIQIYQNSYTIYGVAADDLSEDTVPLVSSMSSYAEYPVIADPDRLMIATGIYDTTRFTDLGWRMFDIMLVSLHRKLPAWQDESDAIQGYFESGMGDYIGALTGNESPQEVSEEIWRFMTTWNLFVLDDFIFQELAAVNPVFIPPFIFEPQPLTYTPGILDTGPYNSNPPAYYSGNQYAPGQQPRWFLGQDQSYTPPFLKDIKLSDLGVSASARGGWSCSLYGGCFRKSATYFYMGDSSFETNKRSVASCDVSMPKLACNDPIVMLDPSESTPEDGMGLTIVEDSKAVNKKIKMITIDGVHRNFTSSLWEDPQGEFYGGEFNVPTGALTYVKSLEMCVWPMDSPCAIWDRVPTVQLWYATHSLSDPGQGDLNGPRSWVGCSTNGMDFRNCYECADGDPTCTVGNNSFSSDKFINVSPVEVGDEELDAMGIGSYISPSRRGFLLFGSGAPARCTPLHLAFVDYADFGKRAGGSPQGVWYFKRAGEQISWESLEDSATPITDDSRCLRNKDDFEDYFVSEPEGVARWNDMSTTFFASIYDRVRRGKIGIAPGIKRLVNNTWPNPRIDLEDINAGLENNAHGISAVSSIVAAIALRQIIDAGLQYGYPEAEAFGELSVKYYEDIKTLVMLSNHTHINEDETLDMISKVAPGAVLGQAVLDVTSDNAGFEALYATYLGFGVAMDPLKPDLKAWWDDMVNKTAWWVSAVDSLSGEGSWLTVDHQNFDNFDVESYFWDNGRVRYRFADIATPWDWHGGEETNPAQAGYGPFIVDKFSGVDTENGRIRLWHLLSTWGGGALPGNYGVYSTFSDIRCDEVSWLNNNNCAYVPQD